MYTQSGYTAFMIKNFCDKETEKIYNQIFSKKIPTDIQTVALRKLIMIDNAANLEDLKVPPANRLESLSGDREGQYSIRINDQYRICFTFTEKMIFAMWKLSIIIKFMGKEPNMDTIITTPTMGEILREEFMTPLNLSTYKLAQELHVPVSRIQAILKNERRITADTSLRLARYFGVSDKYFLDIQNDIDIRELKLSKDKEIEQIIPYAKAM